MLVLSKRADHGAFGIHAFIGVDVDIQPAVENGFGSDLGSDEAEVGMLVLSKRADHGAFGIHAFIGVDVDVQPAVENGFGSDFGSDEAEVGMLVLSKRADHGAFGVHAFIGVDVNVQPAVENGFGSDLGSDEAEVGMLVLSKRADHGAFGVHAFIVVDVDFKSTVVDGLISRLRRCFGSSLGSDHTVFIMRMLNDLADHGAFGIHAFIGVKVGFQTTVTDGIDGRIGGGFGFFGGINGLFGRLKHQQIAANIADRALIIHLIPQRAALRCAENCYSGAGLLQLSQLIAAGGGVAAQIDVLFGGAANDAGRQNSSRGIFFPGHNAGALGQQGGIGIAGNGFIGQIIYKAANGVAGIALDGMQPAVSHVFHNAHMAGIFSAIAVEENEIAADRLIGSVPQLSGFFLRFAFGQVTQGILFICAALRQDILPCGAAGGGGIVMGGNAGMVQAECHKHGAPVLIGGTEPVSIAGIIMRIAAFIQDEAAFVFPVAKLGLSNCNKILIPDAGQLNT